MEQLQQLKQQFQTLPLKEQRLLAGTIAFVFLILFYLLLWEPLQLGLQTEKQKQQSQQEIMIWMQQAAVEARTLRSSGKQTMVRDRNKPTTLVIEQAINNAGLKSTVSKIESSGKNGARVTLKNASFNQILVWLNTLATHNGIQVVSANIERSDKAGRADARLTFERP